MKKHYLLLFSFTVDFVILDQITKFFAMRNLAEPYSIIGNFFTLTYSENPGIAFSIKIPFPLIIILVLAMLVGLLYLAHRELDFSKNLTKLALALVIGGGIGNLIDRLVHGFVVDFISIGTYPIFNLADVFIVIGVLMIILFFNKVKKPAPKPGTSPL